jgi:hypothetical protein
VAPHFIEVEGSADLPGAVRRACAFTTAAPGWLTGQDGATHRHECQLRSTTGQWQDGSPVQWRTESRSVLGGAVMVTEGCAAELTQAIAAALAAAHAPPPRPLREAQTAERVLCLAPAFVEVAREPGLPRVWACAHLSALGPVSAERPWTHLQTAFIRAWPQRGADAYRGELETLPFSALHPADATRSPPRHVVTWSAASLEEAFAAFQALILTPRAAA